MSKCTCAFPCGGTEEGCPSNPSYGKNPRDVYGELAEARREIIQLKLQLEPRSVRDVVSFAYIETLTARQLHELLSKLHTRNQELQAVVNMTAEAFDGGPTNPWIPGGMASKIYATVMKNYAPPLPSGQSGDPSQ